MSRTKLGLPSNRTYNILKHPKTRGTVEPCTSPAYSHHCHPNTSFRWDDGLSLDREMVLSRRPLYDRHYHHHGWIWRGSTPIKGGENLYSISHSVQLWDNGVYRWKFRSNHYRRPNPADLREEKIGEEGQKAQKSLYLMRLWPYRLLYRQRI